MTITENLMEAKKNYGIDFIYIRMRQRLQNCHHAVTIFCYLFIYIYVKYMRGDRKKYDTIPNLN